MRHQLLDLLEARLRRERGRLLGVTQDADHASHLRKRLAPRLLDHLEGVADLLLVGIDEPAHGGRLHRHDADAVPHDVVQLPRDPGPLVGDGASRPLLPFPLRQRGALLRLAGLAVLAADGEPDDPRDREGDRSPQIVARFAVWIVVGDDRRHAEDEDEASDGLRPRRPHAEQEADGQPEQERDERVREPAVDEGAHGDGGPGGHEGSDRVAAAREQQCGDGHDGQHVEPERPVEAALVVLPEDGLGEPDAEPGHDEHVEPVLARQLP